MKKVMCIILVIAMMLGFVAMLAVETFAESYDTELEFDELKSAANASATVIDRLEFYLPKLVPGEAVPEAPLISISNMNIYWQSVWGDGYEATVTDTVFQAGKTYMMTAKIHPNEGYLFAEQVQPIYEGNCDSASYYTSADRKTFEITFDVKCEYEQIDTVQVSELPEKIQAGAAPALQVSAVSGGAQVTGARWVDSTRNNPVTAFQKGQVYYLEVSAKAEGNYGFKSWTDFCSENGLWTDRVVLEDSKTAKAYFRYSLLEQIESVKLAVNNPAQGMEINQLSVTVLEGNVIAMPVQVCDPETGMPVEEPELLDNKYYAIWYSFTPMEGYRFTDDFLDVEVVDCDFELQWSHTEESMVFCRYFNTCDPIEKVEVTLSGATVGGRFDQVTVSVPEGAKYALEEINVYASEEETVFLEEKDYDIQYKLVAADGYAFTYDTELWVNGEENHFNVDMAGMELYAWKSVGFRVNEVYLNNLPHKLTEGPVFGEDEVWCGGQAKVVDAKWVSESKQPVDAWETGKVYYLAVTLEAKDGRKFHDSELIVEADEREYIYDRTSETTAVIYVKYQLLPDAGDVAVTVKGLEEGKNVSDIKVTATGKVKVSNWQLFKIVYDENGYYDSQLVESGKIEKGCRYYVSVALKADEGYSIGEGRYTINGAVSDVGYNEDMLYLSYGFHTCKVITSVAPTLTTPAVGKDAPAPKAESNANYTVSYEWRDVTDDYKLVTGKLEKGHAYELYVELQPKDGYVFDGEYTFKLGGKTVEAYGQSGSRGMEFYVRFSFLDIIEKVELPALPEKITLGQELPTSFTVEGKNYTIEAYWSRYNGGNGSEVTKVEGNDIYALSLTIIPKAGYEFDSEKTKVYIGNKEVVSPFLYVYDTNVNYNKIYTVGVELIKKIELTISKLEAGKLPTISVSDSANYILREDAWAQSNSASFDLNMEGVEIVEKLANGKYTFAGVMLMPKDGYAISEDVEFYVNGKKVTPTAEVQQYVMSVAYLPMGKLGEIEKLTAPKVEVQGNGIAWESVLSADCYEIYRATSKSGKYTKVTTVEETSWEDTAMAKTYYYKVKAICSVDSSKSSSYSNVVSVKFLLEAPVITMGMDEKLGKAIISWNAVEGAKSYEIWRATSETGKYTRISTTKASVTEYTDKYAAVGTAYFYKVKAVASSTTYNSPYSNILSATSVCAQAKLTAKMDTATGKPVISWDKVDGAQNYWLLRRVAGSDVSFEIISRQTKLTFTDTTAQVDVEYEYTMQVIGKEPELDSAFSANVTAVCGLAKPALKGVITDQGKPQLTWEAVEGAVKYQVYRSTSSSKGYTLLGDAYSTGVDDMSAAVGKTYYYKIVAVGENGKSPESSYVKLTGKCAAPMIYVENAASGKPLVSWGKVDGAKQYTIYRASSETGKYSKAGTTKSLYYEDKKASGGKTYFYKVVANASKSSYNSGYSNIFSCDVICGAPSVTVKVDIATGKPMLSWKKVDLAAGYRIYRQLPGQEFEVIAEQTGLSFVDTTAPIDTLCIYKVQTIGKTEGLDSGFTKELSVTSAIAQPKLNAGVNADGKPRFNWQQVEGAVKYEIYRSTKSTKGYTLLATVEDGNAYVDNTVAGGKTFYYKVKAVGNVSSSESSYVKLTGKCAAPFISIDTTSGKPVLSWEKVSGAKQYTVYRATSMEGKYTKLGTTKSGTYTDSKAQTGGEYYYKVIANGSKSSYNSIYSNVKMAFVPCAAPKVTVKNNELGQPVISWGKVTGAAQYKIAYQLGYMGTGGYGCQACDECDICEEYACEGCDCADCICNNPFGAATGVYVTGTSFTITDADVDMVGWVEVTAIAENELLNSAPGEAEVAILPATPKASVKLGENGKPVISWVDNGDAIIYEIYRSTKSSSGYKLVGTVENMGEGEDFEFVTEYQDSSAAKGKTYYYKVVAKSWWNKSAMSSYVKIKSK